MFDISFYLSLHLLMFLGLPSLLVELCLELLDLVGDFLFAPKHFLKFSFFPQKVPPTILDFISHLLCVLEVHLFNLAVSRLNIVAEFIGDGFFAHQSRPNIE